MVLHNENLYQRKMPKVSNSMPPTLIDLLKTVKEGLEAEEVRAERNREKLRETSVLKDSNL